MTHPFRVIVSFLSLAALAVAVTAAPSQAPTEATPPKSSPTPSFRQDIIPILTKAGCNSGACHGKLAGQNGFKLSLRGYAPEWDYDSIVSDIGSRRLDLADAGSSLLLQKAAGQVSHEGGKRFDTSSRLYKTLLEWIDARAPGPIAEDVDPVQLTLSPAHQVIKVGATQPLKVTAKYPDGRERDVTWLAQFYSNDPSTA